MAVTPILFSREDCALQVPFPIPCHVLLPGCSIADGKYVMCSAGGSARQLAAAVLPYARILAAAGSTSAGAVLPRRWTLWNGQLVEQDAGEVGSNAAPQNVMEGADTAGGDADPLEDVDEIDEA